jgi:hypothetical protein
MQAGRHEVVLVLFGGVRIEIAQLLQWHPGPAHGRLNYGHCREEASVGTRHLHLTREYFGPLSRLIALPFAICCILPSLRRLALYLLNGEGSR